MLVIDELPGVTAPLYTPPFQKQIRYMSAAGAVLLIEDATEIFDRAEAAGRCGAAAVDVFARLQRPDNAAEVQTLCYWPTEGRWVITSRFNFEIARQFAAAKTAEERARSRRFAAMQRGRDW
ncbi:MAG: hypothetical protein Q7V31_16095 [Parvibaculum sp.]|uniref:hypothetical protein n=1 Tax=Parvibaculum sp. TaxID=2024848 RepID=UPI00271FAF6F|nr:hypothetical protein [Parvibaculum sp.]MDO8840435.1 hypothetical protein [Parvibaculum sp.]